ncbi:glycosyltransferase [Rossellomorea sp. GAMAL-10_SWC]
MHPKISIIVPIYNVENYIHKCIDSILSQTFSDFELILVNDGSPDRCGNIAEEYSKKDSRIIVIHKKNGGLSDARNSGIEIAKGEYIGFVDGDDWIEPDMYKLLYDMCVEKECEIASCNYFILKDNEKIENNPYPLMVQSRKEAMRTLLDGKMYNEVVCTKLFKRSLFEKQRFKIGIIHEDTDFTYRMIHESKKVCCVGSSKYNYLQRSGSIMEDSTKNIKIDSVLIYIDMYNFMIKYYPELCNKVLTKLVFTSLHLLNLFITNTNFSIYKNEYYKVTSILNKYSNKTVKLKELPFTVKILLLVIKIHPLIYRPLLSLIQIKHLLTSKLKGGIRSLKLNKVQE